jgi:glycogen synthase
VCCIVSGSAKPVRYVETLLVLLLLCALQGEFNALRDQLMRSYPDRAALFFSYDEPLSHLIYAASDMFLVPSMFEPCGLTQVGCASMDRGRGC